MLYYSYKVHHDFGLAPNPFGGYCTLAVCKPTIRAHKQLRDGDWVIGTGSMKLKTLHRLIYVMQVEEKLTFNEYWDDPRFQYKKPILNGSLVQMYGDNFYHQALHSKRWIQEDSAHSLQNGKTNKKHLKLDTTGEYVLIARIFYYFGDKAILIPIKYRDVCCEGRNMKGHSIPAKVAEGFINWVQKKYQTGIHGDPINWSRYK